MCDQALSAEATVERFHKGIVAGLARSAIIQRNVVLARPAIRRFRDELQPIMIHANGLWRTADRLNSCHRFDHGLALEPPVAVNRRQSFAGEGVNNGQRVYPRPSNRASETKSVDHILFAASAAG